MDYWQVYYPVGILWNNSLVNAACEFDSIRYKSRGEVWIPSLAVPSIVQIDTSYPVVGETGVQLLQVIQEHSGRLLVVVDEKHPLVL